MEIFFSCTLPWISQIQVFLFNNVFLFLSFSYVLSVDSILGCNWYVLSSVDNTSGGSDKCNPGFSFWPRKKIQTQYEPYIVFFWIPSPYLQCRSYICPWVMRELLFFIWFELLCRFIAYLYTKPAVTHCLSKWSHIQHAEHVVIPVNLCILSAPILGG